VEVRLVDIADLTGPRRLHPQVYAAFSPSTVLPRLGRCWAMQLLEWN
jgi:hypothetical protein